MARATRSSLRKRPPAPASPRRARPSAREERLEGLIDELRTAAEAVGIRVRRERLLRDVGYQVKSGLCRLQEQEMLLLEQGLSADVQIDLLVNALSRRDLAGVPLSEEARDLLRAGETA